MWVNNDFYKTEKFKPKYFKKEKEIDENNCESKK